MLKKYDTIVPETVDLCPSTPFPVLTGREDEGGKAVGKGGILCVKCSTSPT